MRALKRYLNEKKLIHGQETAAIWKSINLVDRVFKRTLISFNDSNNNYPSTSDIKRNNPQMVPTEIETLTTHTKQ